MISQWLTGVIPGIPEHLTSLMRVVVADMRGKKARRLQSLVFSHRKKVMMDTIPTVHGDPNPSTPITNLLAGRILVAIDTLWLADCSILHILTYQAAVGNLAHC